MYVIVCEVACNLCVCKNFDSEQTQRDYGSEILEGFSHAYSSQKWTSQAENIESYAF